MKKGGIPHGDTAFWQAKSEQQSATIACGAASGTSVALLQVDIRRDGKPKAAKIDFNRRSVLQKAFINEKFELIDLEHVIGIFRLIQSHGQ
jgi:hypothetical protein